MTTEIRLDSPELAEAMNLAAHHGNLLMLNVAAAQVAQSVDAQREHLRAARQAMTSLWSAFEAMRDVLEAVLEPRTDVADDAKTLMRKLLDGQRGSFTKAEEQLLAQEQAFEGLHGPIGKA